MRILAVLHTPRSPHSAVWIGHRLFGDWLERRGHCQRIITPDDLAHGRRAHARWLPLVYPLQVAAWLSRHGQAFDAVMFHSYAGWADACRRGRRYRVITDFHGLEPLYYRELDREARRQGRPLRLPFRLLHGALMPRLLAWSCRRSDAVFCLNREEARFLDGSGWSRRVATLGHGIGDDWFEPREASPVARNALFVGQWLPMKGVTDLVDAFTRVAARSTDLRLACVGTLADAATVLAGFPDSVRPRVSVTPRVEHDELRAWYRAADLFVFPTISEGFSRALLEAMATGLPIVTTPVGAAPDLLESGHSCLMVPTRDPAALAEAVTRLVRDREARDRFGRAAQDRARSYTEERMHASKLRAIEAAAAGA